MRRPADCSCSRCWLAVSVDSGRVERARVVAGRAVTILTSHFGSQYWLVQELTGLQQHLASHLPSS